MFAILFPPVLRAATRRAFAGFALACAGLAVATPAGAQAVYQYTGNPFTLFSCGPSSPGPGTSLCATAGPNINTSYLSTDKVTATLSLTSALPVNLGLTDVRTYPGFQLTMNDGRHTVTNADALGMFAEVATDANGNIVNWRLVINTGGFLNGGISTTKSTFVSDGGTLACCDPSPPGDSARNFNLPGTWTSGPPSPAAAVANLRDLVASPSLGLTVGQINNLTDKLNNVLASIAAGENKQAVNQLKAFINSVDAAQKTFKLSAQAAAVLIAAANAVIAML